MTVNQELKVSWLTHHHQLHRHGSANVPSTNSSLFPSNVRILKIPIFIPFLLPAALYLPLVVVKAERLMLDVSPRLGEDIVVFFLAQSPVAVVVEEFIPGGALDGTQDEREGARRQGCDAYCELPRVTGYWWCVWRAENKEISLWKLESCSQMHAPPFSCLCWSGPGPSVPSSERCTSWKGRLLLVLVCL